MARKRFNDEQVLNLLRQIELSLSSGSDVTSCYKACEVLAYFLRFPATRK